MTETQIIELSNNLESLSNGDTRFIVEFLLTNKDKTIEEMLEHTQESLESLISSIEN